MVFDDDGQARNWELYRGKTTDKDWKKLVLWSLVVDRGTSKRRYSTYSVKIRHEVLGTVFTYLYPQKLARRLMKPR